MLLKCLSPAAVIIFMCFVASSESQEDWSSYKLAFNKSYVNATFSETYAQWFYSYNKIMIDRNNAYYDRRQRTLRLKLNQFSDMRMVRFSALFPKTTQPSISNATPLPVLEESPPDSYDPIADVNLTANVEDQGSVCNSGWAYASAKAIELMLANQIGNQNPSKLSAQNLIDCAGQANGCTKQVPQAAFDYLTMHNQDLHMESNYQNNNSLQEPAMCLMSQNALVVTNLGNYSRIPDGNDELLKRYVAAGYPVVIEYDPTSFEFMHYSAGIFQPVRTRGGSHYMLVIGYGTDATTDVNYWLVQNSFGTTWGENGFIRIVRTTTSPIAKSAFLPTELA